MDVFRPVPTTPIAHTVPTAVVLSLTVLLVGAVGLLALPSVPSAPPSLSSEAGGIRLAVPTNTCPNSYFYGSSTSLTLQNVVDCAGAAGFSGNLQITFVSMAYQESNFCAGAIQGGSGTCFVTGPGCGGGNPNAEGILQQGTAGQCPPVGGPFSVTGYSPSSCSTWSGSSSDWGGIYFNPLCSFQWALAYYNQNGGGDYNFWGSYLSGAYCNWAPNGFLGTGSVTCSGSGQNQANLPWSTVCPGNVCPSGSPPLTATYSVTDATNGTSLYCGGNVYVGDTIRFTVSASGGTPPYTYAWAFGDGGTGTGSPTTHVYTATGTFTPMVTVTDSTGATATAGTGCSFKVIAAPVPVLSSFTLSPSIVTVGGSLYANVSASGGTPPLSFAYSGLPAGCTSTNTSHLVCRPSASGNFSVTATVTDHRAQVASKVAHVEVNPAVAGAPTLTSFTVSPPSITLGETTFVNASVTGGTAPYSYAYSGLPGGCASSSSSHLVCAPTATGAFTISVTVTDALGKTASGTASLQVSASGGTGPLALQSFTASSSTFLLGVTTYLNVSVTGGSPPYAYAFAYLPPGCTTSDLASLPCTPTASGVFHVGVTVTDAASNVNGSMLTLTVTAGPTDPTIVAFTATPTTIVVGGTSVLNVTVSGGTAPYTYQFQGLPSGCVSSSTRVLSCTPYQTGMFTIWVIATDAAGRSAATTTYLGVDPEWGTPLRITSFTVSPSYATIGMAVTFTVAVTGGSSPYSAAYAGLPPGCARGSDSSLTCMPTSTGTYNVSVTVSDAFGRTAVSSVILVVQAHNPGGGTPGGGGPLGSAVAFMTSWTGLVIVGLLAVAVVVAAVAIRRRRRSTPPMEQPPPEWPPYEPPPAGGWAGPP